MAKRDYPSNWDSRRKSIYKRDDFTCQNCGRQGGPHGSVELHAHHIVPKSNGGTHEKTNLVTVCKDCHDAIHGDKQAPSGSTVSGVGGGKYDYLQDVRQLQLLVAKYSMRDPKKVITSQQAIQIEEQLLEQCFQAKVSMELSSNDNYPDKVTSDENWNDIMGRHKEIHERVIDQIIEVVESARNVRSTTITASGHSCPGCGQEVNTEEDFCRNCGEELFQVGKCPSCKTPVTPNDSYCGSCGEKLETEETDESQKNIEDAVEEFNQKVGDLNLLNKRSTLINHIATMRTMCFVDHSGIDSGPWNYCPTCGIEDGVWEVETGKAKCILCDSTWKRKGVLSTSWKQVGGDGDRKDPEEWAKRAQQSNSSEDYEDYIERLSAEEIAQRAQKWM